MGGMALCYERTLHCCPIDLLQIKNIEGTGCNVTRNNHHGLSLSLPTKKLLWSDLEVLLTLEDAVILIGDLNSNSYDWKCINSNSNGDKLAKLTDEFRLRSHLASHADTLPRHRYTHCRHPRHHSSKRRSTESQLHRDIPLARFRSPAHPPEARASRRRNPTQGK
ncbi:hypothetical protein EVAR_37898_1 [Eumeta japonica]|uniref:Endonuclease/exonuclease/phosphatase domain-containing protein n=1 Tax=Eumeta variegata TaxID=151549 RepID=A0A4C1Y561_EUMVA|nr:hypothetical protein EVAR_37898_1 [Eumeta japonica]